jgi:hypothetical protein
MAQMGQKSAYSQTGQKPKHRVNRVMPLTVALEPVHRWMRPTARNARLEDETYAANQRTYISSSSGRERTRAIIPGRPLHDPKPRGISHAGAAMQKIVVGVAKRRKSRRWKVAEPATASYARAHTRPVLKAD